MATGIAPSVWADEGEQAILTAVELLDEGNRPHRTDPDGQQMRG